MGRRDSGREREANDLYETPHWVTEALLPHLPPISGYVWEPAAGKGKIIEALAMHGIACIGTDIIAHPMKLILFADFLKETAAPIIDRPCCGILSNPPYSQADAFIEQALRMVAPDCGFVAMLLPSDFDAAQSRAHLFSDCPQFAKTVKLRRRIRWFDGPVRCIHCEGTGKQGEARCDPCRGRGWRKPSPSENHVWHIWDFTHRGAPTLAYAP